MLSILGNWLYTGSLTFLMGTALAQLYSKLIEKTDKRVCGIKYGIAHILFLGIMGTTLYAQIFSLFYRVHVEANILLMIIMAVYAISQRLYIKKIITGFKEDFSFKGYDFGRRLSEKTWSTVVYIVIVVGVLAFALSSSGEAKLIDTEWYHAQTIRWIEECGCVKGVTNLFPSLGYNNAQHYFDALFSMKWLFGQSMRGSGGFFGLVIFVHGILRICQWKRHSRHMADVLAVWEVVYSVIVTAFYADPYVDTLPNVLVLFVVTEWLSLLEEKEENVESLGLYSLLAVFAAVCKMSVAMSVLLAVYPAYLLIKSKKISQILMYLGLGIGIALPFLVTNVITTGYPIYLLSSLDLFNVGWKADAAIQKYSVDSMIAFARMPLATMEEALSAGLLQWVPAWFKSESISHQILYVTILLLVVYDGIQIVRQVLKKEKVDFWILWVRICVYMGLVYWFFTIPQVKYCWSFLIIPVAVIPVYYWETGKHTLIKRGFMLVATLVLLMYAGFYSLRTLGYMKDGIMHYPVMQADYKKYEFDTVEKDGQTFYIRRENGDIACGYYVFPYLDNEEVLDRLIIGERLEDGFYIEN